jgi:hypothetical protein
MNKNNICFFDFETGSLNPYKTQPTMLAAVIIDGRSLELKPDSLIRSYIQPVFGKEECEKLGLDEIQNEALKKTNISRESLINAPTIKTVWKMFTQYLKQYSIGKGKWDKPVRAGFNIHNFDDPIINRLCNQFGQKNEKGEQNIFHPAYSVDLMELMWIWTEDLVEVTSNSMDFYRNWMNIPKEGAHRADVDVVQGAELLSRVLQVHRKCIKKVRFAGSFEGKIKNGHLLQK